MSRTTTACRSLGGRGKGVLLIIARMTCSINGTHPFIQTPQKRTQRAPNKRTALTFQKLQVASRIQALMFSSLLTMLSYSYPKSRHRPEHCKNTKTSQDWSTNLLFGQDSAKRAKVHLLCPHHLRSTYCFALLVHAKQ